jgi:hypothetical protein
MSTMSLSRDQEMRMQASGRVYQQRYDDALQPWDIRAPAPVLGQPIEEYRCKLARLAKHQLPEDHQLRKIQYRRQRVASPWFPDEGASGDAAVGIFFAQHCPGYITEASRGFMHTFLQMKAREAYPIYNEIVGHIREAMVVNGTSDRHEIQAWCVAAEPRVFDIQTKIGQLMK